MGNRLNRIFKYSDRDLVSERSLSAVEEVVDFLKQNIRQRNIFYTVVYSQRVEQISNELERGGNNIRSLLEQTSVIETAAALQHYLMRLKRPLIPKHIQAIGLENNEGITPDIVAQDILGLLRQDVTGRHARLVTLVLDLLHCVVKNSPTDELSGSHVPITMLPLFFEMEPEHITRWRRVASVFVEMILLAPEYLNLTVNNEANVENLHPNDNIIQFDEVIYGPQLINLVYRRYLIRTGNRGDVPNLEVYFRREPNNFIRLRPLSM